MICFTCTFSCEAISIGYRISISESTLIRSRFKKKKQYDPDILYLVHRSVRSVSSNRNTRVCRRGWRANTLDTMFDNSIPLCSEIRAPPDFPCSVKPVLNTMGQSSIETFHTIPNTRGDRHDSVGRGNRQGRRSRSSSAYLVF